MQILIKYAVVKIQNARVSLIQEEFNVAEKEYFDYQAACAEWKKTCGNEAGNSMSIRDRLKQKEQIVKEREANRVHQAKQKDIGVR